MGFFRKSNFAYAHTWNQLVGQRERNWRFFTSLFAFSFPLSASQSFKLYKSVFYWSLCLLLIQQQQPENPPNTLRIWINYSSKFSSTDWEIWNRSRIADKHFLISKLTWVAWRSRDRPNDRVFLCVFFDQKAVASFIENWRSLRRVNYADEDFCILCCSQSATIDGRNVQSMKRLSSTGKHVGPSHENFSSHSIDSKNSGIVAGHYSICNGSEASWIGITSDDNNNWCGRRQRFTQRYVVLAGIKGWPIVVNVCQLYFDHCSRA